MITRIECEPTNMLGCLPSDQTELSPDRFWIRTGGNEPFDTCEVGGGQGADRSTSEPVVESVQRR
jgi:hypothetical protein